MYANASLRDTRYSSNSVFDNRGYNVRGGLDWSTVERVSGSISYNANRSLQRFNSAEIGFLREKNLETVRSLSASASLGLITEYSLEVQWLTAPMWATRWRSHSVQAREFSQESANIGAALAPQRGQLAATVGGQLTRALPEVPRPPRCAAAAHGLRGRPLQA